MNESDERTALVTGGTDGIGRAVALDLARGGDRVLFVGRSEARGAQVLAALRELRPGVEHAFIRADLSLLAETARVAEEVGRRAPRLDAAVFCAGLLSTVPEWTEEGLERNFVLNYLTRYLMARRLLPALTRAPSGRVVLVANAGKYGDTLDLEDLQHRRGKPGLHVAGRTQFANDLLATELASQVRGTRVEVNCVRPATCRPGLDRSRAGAPPAPAPGHVAGGGSPDAGLSGPEPRRAGQRRTLLRPAPRTASDSGPREPAGPAPRPVGGERAAGARLPAGLSGDAGDRLGQDSLIPSLAVSLPVRIRLDVLAITMTPTSGRCRRARAAAVWAAGSPARGSDRAVPAGRRDRVDCGDAVLRSDARSLAGGGMWRAGGADGDRAAGVGQGGMAAAGEVSLERLEQGEAVRGFTASAV